MSTPTAVNPKTRWGLVSAALFVVAAVFVSIDTTDSHRSVELYFSDASPAGLGILPASCESEPPFHHFSGECTCPPELTNTADSGGYKIGAGEVQHRVNRQGIFFCIDNGSGNSYFIPTHSLTELEQFVSSAGSLSGVSLYDMRLPPPPPTTQCNDGSDNDADGLVDMADPQCTSPAVDLEWDGVTIICTELNRQGRLPDEWMLADAQFGARMPQFVMDGYYLWARPVVYGMQHSVWFTDVVESMAKPWAQEMAYQMGATEQGSLFGKILMMIGVPFSGLLGLISSSLSAAFGVLSLL